MSNGVNDDDSSYDEDYNFESNTELRRFPIHACCEEGGDQRLRSLIFVSRDTSSASSDDNLGGDGTLILRGKSSCVNSDSGDSDGDQDSISSRSSYSSSSVSSATSSTKKVGGDVSEDDDEDDEEEAKREHASAAAAAMGHHHSLTPTARPASSLTPSISTPESDSLKKKVDDSGTRQKFDNADDGNQETNVENELTNKNISEDESVLKKTCSQAKKASLVKYSIDGKLDAVTESKTEEADTGNEMSKIKVDLSLKYPQQVTPDLSSKVDVKEPTQQQTEKKLKQEAASNGKASKGAKLGDTTSSHIDDVSMVTENILSKITGSFSSCTSEKAVVSNGEFAEESSNNKCLISQTEKFIDNKKENGDRKNYVAISVIKSKASEVSVRQSVTQNGTPHAGGEINGEQPLESDRNISKKNSTSTEDYAEKKRLKRERKSNKERHRKHSKIKSKRNAIDKNKSSRPSKKPKFYSRYDLDERDDDENTPLHVAIHAQQLECVKLLLAAGANVQKKSDGSGPVHLAISLGAVSAHASFTYECLEVLVTSGEVDLGVRDDSLHTPLYLCCMYNLPQCAHLILTDSNGLQTLNARSDRSGGRALHACAKFDVTHKIKNMSQMLYHNMHHSRRNTHLHQPQHNGPKSGYAGPTNGAASQIPTGESAITRLLINTTGIEIDAIDSHNRTPLHIACSRGNWNIARLFIQAGANPMAIDNRGRSPYTLALKRGMVVPGDLIVHINPLRQGGNSRDMMIDPDSVTLILCHELCSLHRSCPPIVRGSSTLSEPPPENVRRLHVLINKNDGIFHSNEFASCSWEIEARRAAMADVLRVHEYSYVEKLSLMCS
eukprot:CAMPEP_0194382834 /NCGR_PEP_ID=MMETSP0174-20130528/63296_1 /TAXON_ID=216777 /ORGANISM="Proboscia alata, Strain PI-D3" /LENGTH=836 /DNA_ID=CAMNT_0039168501 /DNA_START=185 /DNA_END=2692 /DNA_ORIENTATION=-